VVTDRALADTSIFIAQDGGRRIDVALLPERLAVSVITIGELRAGVLAAIDTTTRDRRLDTLTAALTIEPVPIDSAVAAAWARLRVALRDAGARMPVNDSWIAATALALEVPVLTQDADFPEVGGLQVIRV
jgi:predicted nucleic acid-binding protein